jgi:hypothetical protein
MKCFAAVLALTLVLGACGDRLPEDGEDVSYDGRLARSAEGPISLETDEGIRLSLFGVDKRPGKFRPGDRVRVEGTFAEVTAYQQGGVRVERIGRLAR